MDDPFKPLSAKAQKPRLTISGRLIESPKKAEAAAARSLKASIKNKIKYRKSRKDNGGG